MKKLLLFIFIGLLFSCESNKPEIKFSNKNDTLEVTKRYPSKKIKEVVFYKNNWVDSNVCYTEKGDVIKYPKLIHVKETNSLFFFIPLTSNYDNVSLIFKVPTKTDSFAIFSLENFKRSLDIPIDNRMIYNDSIVGAIKGKKPNGSYDMYPFKISL